MGNHTENEDRAPQILGFVVPPKNHVKPSTRRPASLFPRRAARSSVVAHVRTVSLQPAAPL